MTLAPLHQVLTLRMSPSPQHPPASPRGCQQPACPPCTPALGTAARPPHSSPTSAPGPSLRLLGRHEGTQPHGAGGPAHPHVRCLHAASACLPHGACGTSALRHGPEPRRPFGGWRAGRLCLERAGAWGLAKLGQHGLELGLLSTSLSRLSWQGKLRWLLPRRPPRSVLLPPTFPLGLSFPHCHGSRAGPSRMRGPGRDGLRLPSAGCGLGGGVQAGRIRLHRLGLCSRSIPPLWYGGHPASRPAVTLLSPICPCCAQWDALVACPLSAVRLLEAGATASSSWGGPGT